MKKIFIIGSGFSSISASTYLAKKGHDVTVFEKNSTVGGRARQFKKDGFTFDIGPSWYWMPDVFESYFNDFGKKVSDYYNLEKLNPAYEVYFNTLDSIKIGDSLEKICAEFERIETGSSILLKRFMKKAEKHYEIAVKDMVYKPGISPLELVNSKTIVRLKYFFTNIKKEVEKDFKNEKLSQILQFPVLFLGAKPSKTPAFYNFMNHADFGLGTWHPKNGMYSVIEGMKKLAEEMGVSFETNQRVEKIIVNRNAASGIVSNGENKYCDVLVSGADYHHTESLLEKKFRSYDKSYWERKIFAPSSLLFFVGLDKKIKRVSHHTLFFDVDFDLHAAEIYDKPKWPSNPLFYGNFPSITDPSMAPAGKEACFFLIPIAPGISDSQKTREKYFEILINRLEKLTNQSIKDFVLFKESFCVKDFEKDYNSYKGNAYGLANTLKQTAFLRPKMISKKVKNLYFTGQLTVPGPGVPPSIISGKIVSDLI
ncbi:MAG: phytoene desaturase family protein [Flavobacteriaceae bacterium]|tara:strand:- start:3034 stop:4479 length:1446 start_codon:yes stop_codon:yes gene_type:complete